jgi:RNA polymerase sigma-70 factor, ECF subfamily
VRATQRGSQDAVEELFTRHWRAYRAALLVTGDRTAAEDIAQESFLAALRALPRLTCTLRPGGCTGSSSTARSTGRAPGSTAARSPPTPPDPSCADDSPALRRGHHGGAARARAEQQAVIVLRYVLDFTPGEIGAALDLPDRQLAAAARPGRARRLVELSGSSDRHAAS